MSNLLCECGHAENFHDRFAGCVELVHGDYCPCERFKSNSVVIDVSERLFSLLQELRPAVVTRTIIAIWRFEQMLVIKDTQGDFGGDLKITAVDAKGAVIDKPAGLKVEFTSDKPEVIAVTQSPDDQYALTCSVGSPGQATIIANVSEGDKLLFTASETFTVTTGDVAAVTAGKLEFPSIAA